MEIIILGEKVDTKEITAIWEIEKEKKMFLNREAGFVIKFMDGSTKAFKEDIPYESYPRDIAYAKDKWEKLQQEVYDKWQKDKHQLMEFGFDKGSPIHPGYPFEALEAAEHFLKESTERESELRLRVFKLEEERNNLVSHMNWIIEAFGHAVNEDYSKSPLAEIIADFYKVHEIKPEVVTTVMTN